MMKIKENSTRFFNNKKIPYFTKHINVDQKSSSFTLFPHGAVSYDQISKLCNLLESNVENDLPFNISYNPQISIKFSGDILTAAKFLVDSKIISTQTFKDLSDANSLNNESNPITSIMAQIKIKG